MRFKRAEIWLHPKVYMVLHRVHKKTASKFWRWSVWRLYPPDQKIFALICPPHLWSKDPTFNWKEEGGGNANG